MIFVRRWTPYDIGHSCNVTIQDYQTSRMLIHLEAVLKSHLRRGNTESSIRGHTKFKILVEHTEFEGPSSAKRNHSRNFHRRFPASSHASVSGPVAPAEIPLQSPLHRVPTSSVEQKKPSNVRSSLRIPCRHGGTCVR